MVEMACYAQTFCDKIDPRAPSFRPNNIAFQGVLFERYLDSEMLCVSIIEFVVASEAVN